jgi:hypothetical protein
MEYPLRRGTVVLETVLKQAGTINSNKKNYQRCATFDVNGQNEANGGSINHSAL